MKKYFLMLLVLSFAHIVSAQLLEINGYIIIDDASTEGARVTIFKNNEKIEAKIINKKGKFDLKFSLDADYRLSFEKNGYIPKQVSINTEVPPEIVESNPNFPPVKLIINLLPAVEGVDLSIFEQPIAILAYNYELDDFTFDKEYSSKIKDKIAQVEQQVRNTLKQRGSAALEKERLFAEWSGKGQEQFNQKKWQDAINAWNEALKIKPEEKDILAKIDIARKENELEQARLSVEAQNNRSYQLLIHSGDSLFTLKEYPDAREKYTAARSLKSNEAYPVKKIDEIDKLLAQLALAEKAAAEQLALKNKYQQLITTADRQFQEKNYNGALSVYREALGLNIEKEYPATQIKRIGEILQQQADLLKQETELAAKYNKLITQADNNFNAQAYEEAIQAYTLALTTKPQETYPKSMITKAETAILDLKKQKEEEDERLRQEAQQKAELMERYNKIIAQADAAFKAENYAIARTHYMEAEQLNTQLPYPANQIKAIDAIFNSAKYQQRLAEYNKNKKIAEADLAAKKYASAKFYYQKAMDILPIDKENMIVRITEIDELIKAEQLAAIEQKYQEQITKADQAYKEKSYAIAKFYYQKALNIKEDDQYAKERLTEVEKFINERSEKTVEL